MSWNKAPYPRDRLGRNGRVMRLTDRDRLLLLSLYSEACDRQGRGDASEQMLRLATGMVTGPRLLPSLARLAREDLVIVYTEHELVDLDLFARGKVAHAFWQLTEYETDLTARLKEDRKPSDYPMPPVGLASDGTDAERQSAPTPNVSADRRRASGGPDAERQPGRTAERVYGGGDGAGDRQAVPADAGPDERPERRPPPTPEQSEEASEARTSPTVPNPTPPAPRPLSPPTPPPITHPSPPTPQRGREAQEAPDARARPLGHALEAGDQTGGAASIAWPEPRHRLAAERYLVALATHDPAHKSCMTIDVLAQLAQKHADVFVAGIDRVIAEGPLWGGWEMRKTGWLETEFRRARSSGPAPKRRNRILAPRVEGASRTDRDELAAFIEQARADAPEPDEVLEYLANEVADAAPDASGQDLAERLDRELTDRLESRLADDERAAAECERYVEREVKSSGALSPGVRAEVVARARFHWLRKQWRMPDLLGQLIELHSDRGAGRL